MSQQPITRLFPTFARNVELQGLYLGHELHTRSSNTRPFVYSNFIASLDGRIALASQDRSTHEVPRSIANLRDWRLYQELAGQADLLITSGRYLRQAAGGEAQDTLPVGTQPEYADIREWRLARGLHAQPDIAIMSASLDLPDAGLAHYRQRGIIVVTGGAAKPDRIRDLENQGIRVIIAGENRKVNGKQMIKQLAAAGYRSIYAIAGPAVFHTLVEQGQLDRLYLTLACQLLGGEDYDTLLQGRPLTPPTGMSLTGLHHDPYAPSGGQLFGIFDRMDVDQTAAGTA